MFLRSIPAGWQADTPAKINLFFEVLHKRSDNFHEIVSVALPLRLFDTLTFEPTHKPAVQFECVRGDATINMGEIPTGSANLVVRAVTLMRERYLVGQGAKITLTKRIPSQAGLGGGSSDAAAALRLANLVWQLNLSESELIPLAAEIGSDCPLFFCDAPTLSTGRGEKIQPLPAIPPLWFVLVKPPEGLSTANVYAECMPTHDGQIRQPHDLMTALPSGDVAAIGKHLFNRLEVPAKKRWGRFDVIKRLLVESGCLAVQMSGSGTAFFGLCQNEAHALEVFRQCIGKTDESISPLFCTAASSLSARKPSGES